MAASKEEAITLGRRVKDSIDWTGQVHFLMVRSIMRKELELHRQYLIEEGLIIGLIHYDDYCHHAYHFAFYIGKENYKKLQINKPKLYENIIAFDQSYGD